ncbi:MAG: RIP metalloprotease RseP [Prevotellaceae bacterium]|jgi:regulator of sigma E protease|nr:RIP metalloprotease RseP [Prevotellaceae bacterium]
MEIIVKAAQLIVSFSILVLVHEFGHFIFARLFKVRVEKFYLFFDAGFALFRHKPKNSETEYGIGWLPFGGYCKISGMIDESMDVEQMKAEPKEWEFRTKPAWQRLLIMIGGVLFNFVLALFIYAGVLAYWGEDYLANRDVKYGIVCDSVAMRMGFRNGDKVVAVNGIAPESFLDIQKRMMLYREMNVTLQRGDVTVNIEPDYYEYIAHMTSNRFIEPMPPFVIKSVPDSSVNRMSNLKPGDEIIGAEGVNGVKILSGNDNRIDEIRGVFAEHRNGDVTVTLKRNGDTLVVPLKVNGEGMIGVQLEADPKNLFVITEKRYGIFSALSAASGKAVTRLKDQLCELRMMVTPKTETYKQVGSIISIGRIYSAQWDWQRFWDITALLSIMLAVLNLLPIPALDGGHAMFLAFEMITRRKLGDKFLTYAQVAGLAILLTIMVYAVGNDVVRHIMR